MKLAVCLLAGSLAVCAATVSFEGSLAGRITILSPGSVIENEARGTAAVFPFGSAEYFKHGFIDFSSVDPEGASTGTGTFEFAFGAGTFYGTYVEKAFAPDNSGTITFSHLYTITGGTGLFAGATGNAAHAPATTTLEDLTFSVDLSGTVSAPRLQPIPEPSTSLLLLGSVGVGWVLRRYSARRL